MSDPSNGAAAGGMMGGDTSMGGDADQDSDDNVVVTICKSPDGSYVVYAGDEPEGGEPEGDESEDDADAMGPAGGAPGGAPTAAPAPEGQPASSIGEALKIAMTIMQEDKSSEGAPGNADDQFAAGFSASQSPTPAKSAPQKY
jgi:hypothetical protein